MSRAQVELGRFSGLNLVDAAADLQPGTALDCLDVRFTERGRVVQRDALVGIPTSVPNGLHSWFTWRTSLGNYYLAIQTNDTTGQHGGLAYQDDGSASVVAGSVASPVRDGQWVPMGTPGVEAAYLLRPGGWSKLVAGGGGSVPTITAMNAPGANPQVAAAGKLGPLASCGCVLPVQNRLLIGGFLDGANGPAVSSGAFPRATVSPHHVYFSEPGDAESWRDTNFFQLTPGDGDAIQAMCAWRDLVFIFKKRRFWVITGSTTDASGVVTINRRAIDVGVGAAGPRAVAVADDGVYFVSERGLYRTRGGDPELLSAAVEPIWTGHKPDDFTGYPIARTQFARVVCNVVGRRVFITYPRGVWDSNAIYDTVPVGTYGVGSRAPVGAGGVLVYDYVLDHWSRWTVPASRFQPDSQVVVGYTSDDFHTEVIPSAMAGGRDAVCPLSGGVSVPIPLGPQGLIMVETVTNPYATGGWETPVGFVRCAPFDDGVSRVHRVAELEVWGSGSPYVGLARDGAVVAAADTVQVALYSAPGDDHVKLLRRAWRGRRLAFYAGVQPNVPRAALGAGWSIDRVVKHIAGAEHDAKATGA